MNKIKRLKNGSKKRKRIEMAKKVIKTEIKKTKKVIKMEIKKAKKVIRMDQTS